MKWPSEMLQFLPYFWNMKTHIVFFAFHFVQLYFFPYECPGLGRHRPWHSLCKNIKLHEMKNEKKYVGFLMHKLWQILKRFSRALS